MNNYIEIDPNVRIKEDMTFVGFEDIPAELHVQIGSRVTCFCPAGQSYMYWPGMVKEISYSKALVYIEVNWAAGEVKEEPISCKSEEGITIGLIDAIIPIGRILAKRDLTPTAVQEALKDLYNDEDITLILSRVEND